MLKLVRDLLEIFAEFMFQDGVSHVLESCRSVKQQTTFRIVGWVVPGERGGGGGGVGKLMPQK